VPARALMFQGTGSDVGKSLIVAGLARAYANRGLRVRPFKPQNMSNNAAVTADGGEIGRAQALQARAARTAPSVHMNPVLLKPQSEIGAQIVVQGRVHGTAKAAAVQRLKPDLMPHVLASFAHLARDSDLVLVEGAGSASEVNLRNGDIANMGFARAAAAAGVPVVLIGDIDRGGVIASLVGTKAVIDPDDAALICGFLVNKFRGDPTLFAPGMARIAEATGWEPLGLVPFFPDARLLPAEDALGVDRASLAPRPPSPSPLVGEGRGGGAGGCGTRAPHSPTPAPDSSPVEPRYSEGSATQESDPSRQQPTWVGGGEPPARIRIGVPILPHIANFDDLDPLEAEPAVDLVRVRPGAALPGDAVLVILPGSKATIADLAVLRAAGFDIDIAAHRRRGGMVVGLCGGYQMLGRRIEDPAGIEGPAGAADGLGLLDVVTVLAPDKRLEPVRGEAGGAPFSGYEMHIGVTTGPDCARPFARHANGSPDGAVSADGRVIGTYIHGLFGDDRQRSAWLARLGAGPSAIAHDALIDATLDRLAAHLATHIDLDRLLGLAR
jgi:adenosylcobyric acid synthase